MTEEEIERFLRAADELGERIRRGDEEAVARIDAALEDRPMSVPPALTPRQRHQRWVAEHLNNGNGG